MPSAISFVALRWDAERLLPNGYGATSDAMDRFTDEVNELIENGATLIATLPLPEPGHALLLFRQVEALG